MIDNQTFKASMRLFASGITVLTWQNSQSPIQGITVSAFSSLSLNPPLVLFCIDQQARVFQELCEQEYIAINILAAGQSALAYQFASPDRSNLHEHIHHQNSQHLPMLKAAQANLLVKIAQHIPQGDHDIFIAQIEESTVYPDRAPLLYYNSQIQDGLAKN